MYQNDDEKSMNSLVYECDDDPSVVSVSTEHSALSNISAATMTQRLDSVFREIDAVESISRRRRQEINAIDATLSEEIMTAPLHCLEGYRELAAVREEEKEKDGIWFQNDHNFDDSFQDYELIKEPNSSLALADDLSSCPEDENNNANRYRQYYPKSIEIRSPSFHHDDNIQSDKDELVRRLQASLRECIKAVISIQANADLKVRKLELKVIQLQNELENERCQKYRSPDALSECNTHSVEPSRQFTRMEDVKNCMNVCENEFNVDENVKYLGGCLRDNVDKNAWPMLIASNDGLLDSKHQRQQLFSNTSGINRIDSALSNPSGVSDSSARKRMQHKQMPIVGFDEVVCRPQITDVAPYDGCNRRTLSCFHRTPVDNTNNSDTIERCRPTYQKLSKDLLERHIFSKSNI